jgi:hypothetical protein
VVIENVSCTLTLPAITVSYEHPTIVRPVLAEQVREEGSVTSGGNEIKK